ncbi:MAG: hypothetical protein A2504_13175 [Bdellovibrionales bacterium RIFOXYD12_FULL_39_22]|nr:MAG: hypothetical protein A2385_00975 [Bdellovibrionales bacterium RIFOXYB1_FULL_39_21]OFZ43579.1 MAG: hypothetical protein A2485_12645 [Bdellovibrionales bacterium RIFOXYC12_FULL_39_17]OFZ44598.1 MAG: hypothetical protein A2404_10335 [Bdellovibrionales bacterium RIFOXYC1_FULL_39_130]OFZ72395.1 MAG: hypothetical protein A2451_11470 [Bdellovibrionales bacterium RIFOXYC2_FULL_39_8]OFZ76357.1 MAG: hypothetical protein A2560_06955 [Bdellovibrionales bacterium RIFOXYD1_FULL_39_84]OFZ94623.1 MAG:
MALKLLLVDPDSDWLKSATEHLQKNMYQVKSVTNGKDAQIAMYNEKFFAVVIGYMVQNHSAMQVLKFIKTNYSAQRVILIMEDENPFKSGETSIDKLIKIGATEVLVKPFTFEALSSVLEGHQTLGDLVSSLPQKEGTSEEVEVQMADENFISIKIDEFYSSKAVLFDIFIKLNSGRYVKILHAGDTFSKERLDKYKVEKKVEFLFFHKSDRRKYLQFTNYITNKIVKNVSISGTHKVDMLKTVSEKFSQEVLEAGLKPQVVQQGKEICTNVYHFIEKQDDLYKLLRNFHEADPSSFTHAFSVTLFASSIIKQFEWQSRATIENTALACMFHDIGKSKLPPELLNKRPADFSDQERALYQQHPQLGAELVEGHILINHAVKQIILQHHEYYNGTGFPGALKNSRILTLANIVALANDFVHIVIDKKVTPVEALKTMLVDKPLVARYNSAIFEKFIRVFADPGKLVKENILPSNSKIVPNRKAS